MTETVEAPSGAVVTRSWWLRWPPSVDEAVLAHGKAVTWLAVAGVAAFAGLFFLHESVLECAHGTVECSFAGKYVDPIVHAASWAAAVASVPLLFLVYARWRHAMRGWDEAVPFAPRRRLLEMAVEDGDLSAKEFERVRAAYEELLSGRTLGHRLRIRADVMWAWGATLAGAAVLVLVMLVVALFSAGSAAIFAMLGVALAVSGVAALAVLSARRVAAMAWQAERWERHTARTLLDRALKKLKVDWPKP